MSQKENQSNQIILHSSKNTLVLQSLEENGVVPEADPLLLILRVFVSGSVIILDSGGDDIQHQGPPAQAEGGDQEDVQGEEVLGQGKLRPVQTNYPKKRRVNI